MDSISKNIGSPYTELWSPRVVTLFMESYRVVDQPTRRRMEELLATWRNAGPGGRPLFGENAQWTIERSLFGSQGAPNKGSPNKAHVVASIERLLALKTQALANRSESGVEAQIDTLRELKDKVAYTNASEELLADVQKQLDVMSNTTIAPGPALASAAPVTTAATDPVPATEAPAPNASELITNLMRAGLLPAAAPMPVQHTTQDKAYTDFIMSLDLRLTTADLSRSPPDLELLIQEHLPLSCRQSAERYPASDEGKRALEDHLDWHFLQNRRSRASIVRGQSRAWFDTVGRWVRSGFDDAALPAHESESDEFASGDPAQEKALRDKIANAYVPVPSDRDVAERPCRICKEKFVSEWCEDVEEWIWKNAVEVDGSYLHASCYYSAKSVSERARLSDEVKGEGSVGGSKTEDTVNNTKTETQGDVSSDMPQEPTDLQSLKRKAEVILGALGNVPVKRQAMEPVAKTEADDTAAPGDGHEMYSSTEVSNKVSMASTHVIKTEPT